MEIGYVVSELWKLRGWVAIGLLVGVLVAMSVMYELPSMQKKSFDVGAASTEVLVEPAGAPLGVLGINPETAVNPVNQMPLYARLITTAPVRERIRTLSGITAGTIATGIPASLQTGRAVASEERATELLAERNAYRILASPSVELPVLTVATQAPTATEAIKLANSAVVALRDYVNATAREEGVARPMRFRQLGPAVGGVVTQNANIKIAALAFFAAFAAWAFMVLVVSRLRTAWRETKAAERIDESLHIADAVPYRDAEDSPALSSSRPPAPVQRAAK